MVAAFRGFYTVQYSRFVPDGLERRTTFTIVGKNLKTTIS